MTNFERKVLDTMAKARKETKMDFNSLEVDLKVDFVPPSLLQMNQKVVENCSALHIEALSNELQDFEFMLPIIVDAQNNVLVGTPRNMAAKKSGIGLVPILYKETLSASEKTAYVFSLAEYAKTINLDKELFAAEIEELRNLGMVC